MEILLIIRALTSMRSPRVMILSTLLTQALVSVMLVLEPFSSVSAFHLHAAVLEDVPFASDINGRERRGRLDALSKEQLTSILKDEAVERLIDLGRISDSDEFLERTFMSPAAVRAGHLIRTWMTDAGLFTWIDDFGNVHGRFDGMNASAPTLIIGSHLDTVIDAGRYDGGLGIVSAIAAVKALDQTGRLMDFPRPIEVIAFSDEEGVRFQSTFLGSGAIAGILPPSLLQAPDKRGVTIQTALRSSSLPGTAESLEKIKYDPSSVWGYVEVHIEQGPVLERLGLPLGVVDAIAGQTRLRVSMKGLAGHAGTVPMNMRRDPMPAAALAIVAIDDLCMHPEKVFVQGAEGSLVCTVGEISSWPGASNVIPGEVTFSVDVRAKSDSFRDVVVLMIEDAIYDICDIRSIDCNINRKHEAVAVECDSILTERLSKAASSATYDISEWTGQGLGEKHTRSVPVISSGAGHDAVAMVKITKVGMLFVRCAGGISHSPLESVLEDDIWAAGLALLSFMELELTPSTLTHESF